MVPQTLGVGVGVEVGVGVGVGVVGGQYSGPEPQYPNLEQQSPGAHVPPTPPIHEPSWPMKGEQNCSDLT